MKSSRGVAGHNGDHLIDNNHVGVYIATLKNLYKRGKEVFKGHTREKISRYRLIYNHGHTVQQNCSSKLSWNDIIPNKPIGFQRN